jgi:hypothetical protein
MNRLYDIFLQRNSSFNGKISVIGHSLGKLKSNLFIKINPCHLGSVILYDILVNQTPANEEEALINEAGRLIEINFYLVFISFFFIMKFKFNRKQVNEILFQINFSIHMNKLVKK